MTVLVAAFALCILIPAGVGALAHRGRSAMFGGPDAWGRAVGSRLRPPLAAVAVLIAGSVVTVGVCIAVGLVVKAVQPSFDEPMFDYVRHHVRGGSFEKLNEKLTVMGNNVTSQLVVLFATVLLAAAYKRRWWLPVVSIVGAFAAEKYLQRFVAHVVHRGHPPTDAGTYPSGGVARVLFVYGVVIVLSILLMPTLSRGWRAGLWTAVTTAAVVEAYTRIYLLKHWPTDTLGGLLLGALGLLTFTVAIRLVATDPVASAPVDADGQRASRHPAHQ